MKISVWAFSLALVAQVSAAPTLPAPPAQAAALPASAVPAPATAPAAGEPIPFLEMKTELKRLMIGNQAGVVKVLGPNRQGVALARCIDDQSTARLNDETCVSIFSALGLPAARVTPVTQDIMINYSLMPHKEAVAFLSVAASSPLLDAATREKTENFLVQVMDTDKDVHARRQAVLALAVKPNVASLTTERVMALYERSENLWETFPVQQYFQYHAPQLRRLSNFAELRQRVAKVNSLYTPAILNFLDHP